METTTSKLLTLLVSGLLIALSNSSQAQTNPTPATVTVTITAPSPANPTCGDNVTNCITGSFSDPQDTNCEITILSYEWSLSVTDTNGNPVGSCSGSSGTDYSGGTTNSWSWIPQGYGTNNLVAIETVTFEGYDCHDTGDEDDYSTTATGTNAFTVIVTPILNIVDGSGNPISSANTNNVAMVGQHIGLTATTGCGTASNFQWSVPGYAISNYTVGWGGSADANKPSTNITTPESLTTYFPTTNSGVSFYWVDGGAKNVSCSAVCGGITCSTNVTITVTRPTLSLLSQSSPVWYDYTYSFYFIGISFGNKANNVNDMEYKVLINSPTYGYAATVQIANSYAINGTEQVTGLQADGCVPYQGTWPGILRGGGSSSFLDLLDTPQAGSYFESVSLAANFNDYVMYQASIVNTIYAPLGGDTIPVPLGRVFWSINGEAYYSSPVSTTINPAEYQLEGPDNSTDFPIWTSIFVPHQ
jgi:hypothetical protein